MGGLPSAHGMVCERVFSLSPAPVDAYSSHLGDRTGDGIEEGHMDSQMCERTREEHEG